jgi:hypothetical protein
MPKVTAPISGKGDCFREAMNAEELISYENAANKTER